MNAFVSFLSFSDPNAVWVMCGSGLLGLAAGVLGCFPYLKRRALIGDVLAHAALPGVTTAFLIFQTKSISILLIGAVISCVIGYLSIDYLVRRTKIKEDTAFALVLSVFFALGIFQLTRIQKLEIAAQAGLDKFLLGQASALVGADVYLLSFLAVTLVLFVAIFFRGLRSITFDPLFAASAGMPVVFYEVLLAGLVIVTVVVGMQLVGVVLLAAVLLVPPAAARYWTNSLPAMLLISGLMGAVSGIVAACISYSYPHMPTGPWMVIVCTIMFVISMLSAPERGVIQRILRQLKYKRRIDEENILRSTYLLSGEGAGSQGQLVDSSDILRHRNISLHRFEAIKDRLAARKLIEVFPDKVRLLPKGFEYAERLTRLHRLWETYLSKHTLIADDHVHADAEEIEHILTKELEEQLVESLKGVEQDPHGSSIPGKSI